MIIDLGEGQDIHPRNKQDVANRLARWALARDYGVKIAYQSPTYKAMEKHGNKIVLRFDHVGRRPASRSTSPSRAGLPSPAATTSSSGPRRRSSAPPPIEVWSDQVSEPVAVRYAWADNPVCNLYSAEGLPLTPFRTDDWPGVTIHNVE